MEGVECFCCHHVVWMTDTVACSVGPSEGQNDYVDHRFCVDCVLGQIDADGIGGLGETRCIVDNCEGVFLPWSVNWVLTEGTRRLTDGSAVAETEGGLRICHRCFRLVEKEGDVECNMVKCRCEGGPMLCVLCGKDMTTQDDGHYRWNCEWEGEGFGEG